MTMLENNVSTNYRENALMVLKKIGLPTKRTEIWRGSDISIFKKDMLPIAERLVNVVLQPSIFDTIDSTKIVFVNGHYHPALSDNMPDGLNFISLSEAIAHQDSALSMIGRIVSPIEQATVALNAVNVRDGAIIKISYGVKLNKPVQLIFKNPITGFTAYGRVLIVAQDYSQADFIVSHDTTAGTFENHVTEIFVGKNAHISYVKSVNCVDAHFGSVSVQLSQNAHLNLGYYTKGAELLRNDTIVNLDGEGANVNIGAAAFVQKTRLNDHTCVVTHNVPYCTSSQVYKNIVADKGRAVTRAKTLVTQNAQKTDGKQMLQALLLNETASSYAKPELEIYADDVKCAHGSTVGQLDKESLFYLNSRGIPYEMARSLLTRAFLTEALSDIIEQDLLNLILNDFDISMTNNA
jgi:Fe-S cluster assembly protein SufD